MFSISKSTSGIKIDVEIKGPGTKNKDGLPTHVMRVILSSEIKKAAHREPPFTFLLQETTIF
ncbi:MAG: hypothetical protein B7Y39_16870 [Bdellovibrio sp. 28-41-41]|nr:MAG: hypothetical protein B7Y39_16870 [Bdellovibrio sp. 28-41-41]